MEEQKQERPVGERKEKRNYSAYNCGGTLAFDPLKELNLPASYDEVVERFRRLQGQRATEVLN